MITPLEDAGREGVATEGYEQEKNVEEEYLIRRHRKLEDESQVWEHNTWDDMEWDEGRVAEAKAIIASQINASPLLADEDAVAKVVQEVAAAKWDTFYNQHNRWFFKDRNWLPSEFPELFDAGLGGRILEIGCGAGNTVFPLAKARCNDTSFHIFACDFAPSAVKLVKKFREFDPSRMSAFIHDLSQDSCFEGVEEGSLDIVVSIFVLSALDPARLKFALDKIYRYLRPGGLLLFRDYGQYDMTQLRFKASRLVRPNLYIRGDGTAVHYFTEEELRSLMEESGFEVVVNRSDRRLLVNRYRKLTMYRIWIQGKFRKPE